MTNPPQVLTHRPQRRLAIVLVAGHILAGAATVLADLSGGYRWALLAALAVSLVQSLRHRREIRIRCGSDGSLDLWRGDEWRSATLQTDSTVLSWLVVLRYRAEGERRIRSSVIMADGMAADDFRRLRVWVRWKAVSHTPTTQYSSAANAELG
jgi:toxin CptA